MLSKLRISAHKLAIECGIYINIPKQERICTAWNTGEVKVEVEDEEHFVSLFVLLLYVPSQQLMADGHFT